LTKLSVCDRFATGACGNRRARGEGQARARFGNARMPRAVGVSETARRGRGRRTLGSLKVMPGSMGRSTPMSSGAGVRSTPGKACGPGSESGGRLRAECRECNDASEIPKGSRNEVISSAITYSWRHRFGVVRLVGGGRLHFRRTRRATMPVRKDVIVLDNGGSTIKVGFAGEARPVRCAPARAPSFPRRARFPASAPPPGARDRFSPPPSSHPRPDSPTLRIQRRPQLRGET